MCFVQEMNFEKEDEEEDTYGPVILRKKRAAENEKTVCQLFIQTDHLFLKYYGSREAVLAQVEQLFNWHCSLIKEATL